MKEDIYDIGMAIQSHISKEKANHTRVPAIGRAVCSLDSSYHNRAVYKPDFSTAHEIVINIEHDANVYSFQT